jgi:hypothetical protein
MKKKSSCLKWICWFLNWSQKSEMQNVIPSWCQHIEIIFQPFENIWFVQQKNKNSNAVNGKFDKRRKINYIGNSKRKLKK